MRRIVEGLTRAWTKTDWHGLKELGILSWMKWLFHQNITLSHNMTCYPNLHLWMNNTRGITCTVPSYCNWIFLEVIKYPLWNGVGLCRRNLTWTEPGQGREFENLYVYSHWNGSLKKDFSFFYPLPPLILFILPGIFSSFVIVMNLLHM